MSNSSKMLNFAGLIAPVFTPFDEQGQLNLSIIEAYAERLRFKGVKAVLVNGTTGEGTSMSVSERKAVTEKWADACWKLEMLLMVQISGCAFSDVIELARHAASMQVNGILCLPELYFKPKTVRKLVDYLKEIVKHCPSIPIYYYHMPSLTQVDLPMMDLMELAKKEIPTFAGIKFSSSELDKAVDCLKYGQVFLGSVKILCGAVALGFKGAIMTLVNIKPDLCQKIVELVNLGKIEEAREIQQKLNEFVDEAMKQGKSDWVTAMKLSFNREFTDLNIGRTRKPL